MLKMATPTQQTFIVDQHKQLVDLNKDLVNFNLNFKVASTSGAPFQAVVVTQRQLDNNMNLQYKNSNPDGTLSGNIVADKNIRNNYILVLKAEQQCEVVVNIDCKPIQANPANMQAQQQRQMQPQQQNGGNMPPQQQQNGGNMPPQRQMMPSQGGGQRFAPQQPNGGGMHSHSHGGYPHGDGSEKSTSNWKYIVTAVVILGGGALLYYFYKKKSTTEQKGGVEDVIKPVVIPDPAPAAPSLVPEVEAPSMGGGAESSKGSSLLSRLQGLNLDN